MEKSKTVGCGSMRKEVGKKQTEKIGYSGLDIEMEFVRERTI